MYQSWPSPWHIHWPQRWKHIPTSNSQAAPSYLECFTCLSIRNLFHMLVNTPAPLLPAPPPTWPPLAKVGGWTGQVCSGSLRSP